MFHSGWPDEKGPSGCRSILAAPSPGGKMAAVVIKSAKLPRGGAGQFDFDLTNGRRLMRLAGPANRFEEAKSWRKRMAVGYTIGQPVAIDSRGLSALCFN
jgi:hypothetical protein